MNRLARLSSLVFLSAGCSLVSLDNLDSGGADAGTSSTGQPTATTSSSTSGPGGGEGAGGPGTGAGPGTGGQGTGGDPGGDGGAGGAGGDGGRTGDGGAGGEGGAGGASTGAGGACGTVSLAADDFSQPFGDNRWYRTDGVTWEAPGVRLRPDDLVDDYDQLASRHRFDLRNDAITAIVTEVTEQAGGETTSTFLLANGEADVSIEARGGELRAGMFVNGGYSQLGATPYTGQTHWRIGHDGQDIVFEASSNGVSFAEIARIAEDDAFVPSQVDVELVTATFGPLVQPGRMEVEAVLGATQGVVACPIGSLVEDFETPEVAAVWEVYEEGSCTTSEAGARLAMTWPSGTGYCSYRSFPLLDLRQSQVVVRSTSLPVGGGGAEGYLELRDREGRGVVLASSGARMQAHRRDPAATTLADVPYDRTENPWWRIRAVDDAVRFEVSGDGTTFELVTQTAVGFDAEAVELIVAGGVYRAQPGSTTIGWDDLNARP